MTKGNARWRRRIITLVFIEPKIHPPPPVVPRKFERHRDIALMVFLRGDESLVMDWPQAGGVVPLVVRLGLSHVRSLGF